VGGDSVIEETNVGKTKCYEELAEIMTEEFGNAGSLQRNALVPPAKPRHPPTQASGVSGKAAAPSNEMLECLQQSRVTVQ
jgi:hypothetical protein